MMYNLVTTMRHHVVTEPMMIKMLTKTMMRTKREKMTKEKQQTATVQISVTEWKITKIAIVIAIMGVRTRTKRSTKTMIEHQQKACRGNLDSYLIRMAYLAIIKMIGLKKKNADDPREATNNVINSNINQKYQ